MDFPYLYEVDGQKLYCNAPAIPGRKDIPCGGQIDYDDGFNNLICTKCGRHYQARELKKAEDKKLIIVGGKKTMEVVVTVGKKVILDSSKNKTAKVIEAKEGVDVMDCVKEEKPIQDKVQSRVTKVKAKPKATKKVVTNIPSDSIFKKEESESPIQEKEEDSTEVKEEVNAETKTTVESMNDELDDVLNDSSYYEDDEYEDDDYSEYDEYLSNRERMNIRNANKKTKKRNKDFSDF